MQKIKQIFTPTSQDDIEERYGKPAQSTESSSAPGTTASCLQQKEQDDDAKSCMSIKSGVEGPYAGGADEPLIGEGRADTTASNLSQGATTPRGYTTSGDSTSETTTSRGYTTSTYDPTTLATKTTAHGYQAEHSNADHLPGTTARGFSTNTEPSRSTVAAPLSDTTPSSGGTFLQYDDLQATPNEDRGTSMPLSDPTSSSSMNPVSTSPVNPTSTSPGYSYPVEPSQPKPTSGDTSNLERDAAIEGAATGAGAAGAGALYATDGAGTMFDYRAGGGLPHIPGEYPITPGDELGGRGFGGMTAGPVDTGTQTAGSIIASSQMKSEATNRNPAASSSLPATTPTTGMHVVGLQDMGGVTPSAASSSLPSTQPTTAMHAAGRQDMGVVAPPANTSTGLTPQSLVGQSATQSDTHYGRDAGIGAGVVAGTGVAGYGAYEGQQQDSRDLPIAQSMASPSTAAMTQPQYTSTTTTTTTSTSGPTTTTTTMPSQSRSAYPETSSMNTENDTNYGRDAAIGATGLAGAGAVTYGGYEALKSDQNAPRRVQPMTSASSMETRQPQHSYGATDNKDPQKQYEKQQKEQDKALAKREKKLAEQQKEAQKDAEREREKREKERLKTQSEENNNYGRDAAIAGGTAGAAGVAGAGAYEATQDSGPASSPTTMRDRTRGEPHSRGQEILSEDNRVSVDDKGHAHLHKKKFDEHGEKKKEGFFSKLMHRNKDKNGKEVDSSSESKGRASVESSEPRSPVVQQNTSSEPRSPVVQQTSSAPLRTSAGESSMDQPRSSSSGIPIGEDGMIHISKQGSHPDAPHMIIQESPGGGLETVEKRVYED